MCLNNINSTKRAIHFGRFFGDCLPIAVELPESAIQLRFELSGQFRQVSVSCLGTIPASIRSMAMRFAFALVAAVGLLNAASFAAEPIHYPETRRVDQVDNFHGTKVLDPYRWLEDDVRKSQEVRQWVEAENKITFAYLE